MLVNVVNKTMLPYIRIHTPDTHTTLCHWTIITKFGNKLKSISGITNHRSDNKLVHKMNRKKRIIMNSFLYNLLYKDNRLSHDVTKNCTHFGIKIINTVNSLLFERRWDCRIRGVFKLQRLKVNERSIQDKKETQHLVCSLNCCYRKL